MLHHKDTHTTTTTRQISIEKLTYIFAVQLDFCRLEDVDVAALLDEFLCSLLILLFALFGLFEGLGDLVGGDLLDLGTFSLAKLGVHRVEVRQVLDELLASLVLAVELLRLATRVADGEQVFFGLLEVALGQAALPAEDVLVNVTNI